LDLRSSLGIYLGIPSASGVNPIPDPIPGPIPDPKSYRRLDVGLDLYSGLGIYLGMPSASGVNLIPDPIPDPKLYICLDVGLALYSGFGYILRIRPNTGPKIRAKVGPNWPQVIPIRSTSAALAWARASFA
jgi:hypothetical protein